MRLYYLYLIALVPYFAGAQPTFTKQESKYFGDIITEGVAIHRVVSPLKSSIGSSTIYVVQAIPDKIGLNTKICKAPEAFVDSEVLATINAPSSGYKKFSGRSNGYKLANSMAYFAWHPIRNDSAYIRFFNRIDFDKHSKSYLNVVEGKLLIEDSVVTVTEEETYMSISAIGLDRFDRLIFLHSRSPYSLHQFASIVNETLKGVKVLILTGQGKESVLGFKGVDKPYFSYGSYQTGKSENDDNENFFATPLLLLQVR